MTQLPTSVPDFSSFESSSVTLQLSHSTLSVFNIYRPPPSSTYSKPLSVFLDDFSSFLSFAATTPHEFIITGDFNIHLDNPADTLASQFLSFLSSFNLSQHVHFPTHDKSYILDLVMGGKVYVVFNRNCFPKIRLFKVGRPTGSHVRRKSGSIIEVSRDCYYTPLMGSIILPIYSCHLQWPWMTLKVIRLMQDLLSAIRQIFARHLAWF